MFHAVLLVCLFACLSSPAYAQPTFDTAATNAASFASSASVNITVGSLTNGILLIEVKRDATFGVTLNTPTVDASTTGVTFLGMAEDASGDDLSVVDFYYKLNPGSGSKTVAATTSGSIQGLTVTARTYGNVNQSTPFGTPATAGGNSSATATVNVSTTAGDFIIDSASWATAGGGRTATVGANQTQRVNNVDGNAGSAGSEETATGGTTTMSWTISENTDWAILAVELNAAGGGATPARRSIIIW